MPKKITIANKIYDLVADRGFIETKVRETSTSLIQGQSKDIKFFSVIKEKKGVQIFMYMVKATDIACAIAILEKEIRKCHWVLSSDNNDESIYVGFSNFSDQEDFYYIQQITPQRILS